MSLPGQETSEPSSAPGPDAAPRAPPLPVDIAFLLAHGVPVAHLQDAVALATRWGVSPPEALLAAGLLDEESFHRALAQEIGVPMLPSDAALDPGTAYPQCIEAGLAPLAPGPHGLHFALAPAPAMVRVLLEQRPPRGRPGLAIVPPRRFQRLVMACKAETIARRAVGLLPGREPALSAHGGASGWQVVALGALGGAAAYPAALAPFVLAQVLAHVCGLLFLAVVTLRLATGVEHAPARLAGRAPRRLPDARLPFYSIIVPLHRERRVLERLVGGLCALDYPPAKLDIKFVIEEDDEETRQGLAELALPPQFDVVVAPPGHPRTKPRALNVALPLARGDYTVVYDAEDVPDPDQLRLAVAAFAAAPPEVACLQARLVIDNTNDHLLAKLFTIEYAALFDVINPGLILFGLPLPLGGTSNHFRTAVLREVLGWDAWNVTEDADLGIRLARKGYKVGDLPSATLEEAPHTRTAWLKQRTRWLKGWMQTCITHSREPLRAARELGLAGSLGTLTLGFGTVLSALVFPIWLPVAIAHMVDGSLFLPRPRLEALMTAVALLLVPAGLAAIYLPALLGLWRRQWSDLLGYVPLLPFYYAFVSLAAWLAVVELIVAPVRWNKTEHGLARTSRAGALRDGAAGPAPPPRADASG